MSAKNAGTVAMCHQCPQKMRELLPHVTNVHKKYVAGTGCYIIPRPASGKLQCRLGYAEEVEWKNGEWHTRLVLNGDQTAHHSMLYVRGRMSNADYNEQGFHIPAPWTDVSSQRMYWKDWQNRYKVSGIYRIKLYTYPR